LRVAFESVINSDFGAVRIPSAARARSVDYQAPATVPATDSVNDPSDRIAFRRVLIPNQGIGLALASAASFGFTFVHWHSPSS
jgi:hypothetical protein